MFFEKKFMEITDDDIGYLIANKIPENKTLEYKRQLPDKNKEDAKLKILQSVCAFANTDGGIIIFGMKENENGEAAEIMNIDTSTDDDFLQIQNMVRNRIEPKITPLDLRELQINGRKIYLMRILASYNKPHVVKDDNMFYGRHSSGKYKLDVGEIRNLFLLNKSAEEKFNSFRNQRLMRLKSDNFFMPLRSDKIIVLHLASLSSLNNNTQIELSKITTGIVPFHPINAHSFSYSRQINYDGIMCYWTIHAKNQLSDYMQVFRNGIIESTAFDYFGHNIPNEIPGQWVEQALKCAVTGYISSLEKLDISYPFFVAFSFLKTKGLKIIRDKDYHFMNDANEIFNDDLILPTVFIEDKTQIHEKLTSSFDIFWNAGGYIQSPSREETPHAHP
jgi:hypothetical protein